MTATTIDNLGGLFPFDISKIFNKKEKGKETPLKNKKSDKEQEKQTSLAEESVLYQSQYLTLLQDLYGYVVDQGLKPNLKKMKEKTIKREYKDLVNNRYYNSSIKLLTGIKNSLGQGFIDLVLGLLAFAFFDPNGTLLSSLIMLFANLLTMVIEVIIKLLPKILGIIVKLIPVLIKAFSQIFTEITKLLPVIIDTIIKMVPEIFNLLVQLIPTIIQGLGDAIKTALGALGDNFPILKGITTALSGIITMIQSIFTPEVVGWLLKGIAIFGAIAAAFIIISNIVAGIMWFLGVIGTILGWIGTAIAIITSPVTWFIAAIVAAIALVAYLGYLIVSNWESIVNFVKESFNNIINFFRSIFSEGILKGIVNLHKFIYKFLWNIFKKFFPNFANYIEDIFDDIISSVGSSLRSFINKIKNFFSWNNIKKSFMEGINKAFEEFPALQKIKDFFDDLLSAITDSTLGQWLFGNKKENKVMENLNNITNTVYGKDIDEGQIIYQLVNSKGQDVSQIFEKSGITDTASQDAFREIAAAIKDMASQDKVSTTNTAAMENYLKQLTEDRSTPQLAAAITSLTKAVGNINNTPVPGRSQTSERTKPRSQG